MRSYVSLINECEAGLPDEFRGEDVRFPRPLVEFILGEFTRPGDLVFDPFAGFGSVLNAAEKLGREGYGMESDLRRVEYARKILVHPERILHGDSLDIASYDLPRFDFVMTSPPYMKKTDLANPIRHCAAGSGYTDYLGDLGAIFRKLGGMVRPGAKTVIEAGNLKEELGVTTLAWDIASAVSKVMRFEGEIVICWDKRCHGYDHTYCMVFSS